MDKIDAFTDSMASNRADISELKGAFSETTRVQTELREIQNNLIGNFSEAWIIFTISYDINHIPGPEFLWP